MAVVDFGSQMEFFLVSVEKASVSTVGYQIKPFFGRWGVILLGLTLIVLLSIRLRWVLYWVPVLLLFVCLNRIDRPNAGQAYVSILDVGQGLAIVVETKSRVMIYDTGPSYLSGWNAGEAVILPYLRSRAITQVDKLMVSHMDNDHSGGAKSLLKHLSVQELMLPPQSESEKEFENIRETKLTQCLAKKSWVWDQVHFEIISPTDVLLNTPLKHGKKQKNNFSCVLKIKDRHRTYLLPGDIESVVEQHLLETSAAHLKADILVAPHHGSKTSSSSGWINKVSPDVVVFSAETKKNSINVPKFSNTNCPTRH